MGFGKDLILKHDSNIVKVIQIFQELFTYVSNVDHL